MSRIKIILVGMVMIIAMSFLFTGCTAVKPEYPGYEIFKVYDHPRSSMAIYKVATPSQTFTVLRDQNGGMIILK
jgi:hypothetical protein